MQDDADEQHDTEDPQHAFVAEEAGEQGPQPVCVVVHCLGLLTDLVRRVAFGKVMLCDRVRAPEHLQVADHVDKQEE